MRITEVLDTELFVGSVADPLQVLRVHVAGPHQPGSVVVRGAGISGRGDLPAPGGATQPGTAASLPVEVGLTGLPRRGSASVTVEVQDAQGEPIGAPVPHEVRVAEPGWTVWMVPHFHYDPVWWNTQAAYTVTWDEAGEEAQRFRSAFQQTGFALVDLHLRTARRDADYKFVLAEVDYLKPYWDARPQDRAYLRRLLREGRLEIMGGTYNEPNTNLTSAETTARNFVYGVGFQRGVLGGDPQTAWQLDVFGHDPQFPGMAADAGLTSTSWARGPFHQWGPMLWTHAPKDEGWGDPSVMQFPAEFEWLSPSGRGVLTHYMPAHYSAGWQIDSQADLAGAEHAAYHLFTLLKRVAATRNVLLPVGTDYTPPSKWVTEIHRDWAQRYVWPRMVCGLPSEFFAAVRAELDSEGRHASAQTRDMNPIYTGKDVSYIDTKQAQRQAESLLLDAEKFATLAMVHGAGYPHVAMDKAWRQLIFGAHHDAITGSESDQVYIDLLSGWREAHDVGRQVLAAALGHLDAQIGDADPGEGSVAEERGTQPELTVTVFNPSSWSRRDLVSVDVSLGPGGESGLVVIDPDGGAVPALVEQPTRHPDGSLASARVTFAASAPGIGYRSGWRVRTQPVATDAGWTEVRGEPTIDSAGHRVRVDPGRGGAVCEVFDKRAGRQVLRPDSLGNELLIHQEYPEHPRFHEGPWHLVPKGEWVGSSARPADSVRVERSPLGRRLVVSGTIGVLRYTQYVTLLDGFDRVDCVTDLHGFAGADELIRVSWPVDVPGGLPVSEVGHAVVGRGFALIEADTAEHPWTLDNPANHWFGVSSTVRVRITDAGAAQAEGSQDRAVPQRAIGIAELVAPDGEIGRATRELAIALAGQGVTATSSRGDGPRYGKLDVDSNLPDVRIALGGPDENEFVAARLAAADPSYRLELDKQLAEQGSARVWVPADRPLAEVWQPSADLTDPGALPVLVLAGQRAAAELAADLSDAVIEVVQHAVGRTPGEPDLADYTVGLLNQGVPGFAVDSSGALHLSLLRSCTGWPSGVWIDPPRRTAPDGSHFQQEHWSHRFSYGLHAAAGDWRASGLVRAGHDYNHPLYAVVRGKNARTTNRATGAAGLPAELTMLGVESDGDVVVAALKPRGNPLTGGASGSTGAAAGTDGATELTVRLYEAAGGRSQVRLRTNFSLLGASWLNLLEQPLSGDPDAAPIPTTPSDGALIDVTPMQIATIGLSGGDRVRRRDSAEVYGSQAEPHQPVYSRYWLNNTGPAPRGNIPIAVHVEPALVERPAGSGDGITLTVLVAANHAGVSARDAVQLQLPDGWGADRDAVDFDLDAAGFVSEAVTVRPPADTACGTYWIRARIRSGGQLVEDVCRVVIGRQDEPELGVRLLSGPLRLAPGEHGEVVVELASTARTPIAAQVQLIGPWPTWPLVADWDGGVEVEPGRPVQLRFAVQVPRAAPAGSWWVLAKVAAAGLLHYTEPIAVEVLAGGDR